MRQVLLYLAYYKHKKCIYKFDRYLKEGRETRENRLVKIQAFSFINPNKKDYEIITAENIK
jgi:hypothetical protein